VTVELKNDMEVEGCLESIDQYLNVKLADIQVVNEEKFPHLVLMRFMHAGHLNLLIYVVGSEELFHSRLGGQVCAGVTRIGRHGIAAGCSASRV